MTDRPPAQTSGPATGSLPPSHAIRWYARHKTQIVEAVRSGRIGLDEALAKYRLSLDEFRDWQRYVPGEDFAGLRSAHARIVRIARGRKRRGGVRPRP